MPGSIYQQIQQNIQSVVKNGIILISLDFVAIIVMLKYIREFIRENRSTAIGVVHFFHIQHRKLNSLELYRFQVLIQIKIYMHMYKFR